MPEMDKSIRDFVDLAKRQGVDDRSLVVLLRGRGWPEEDACRALADYYEAQNSVAIPAYKRPGSAKDAFFYLLSFSMLATWTISLGSVLFMLIDTWIKDPISSNSNQTYRFYEMANSLACMIVAFPVYIFTVRSVLKDIRVHPEKLDSSVRKWLTYIALLIAAGVVVGDLITFLTYFLRGELTARFVSKVIVVLVIAGGVFWYYLGSLQEAARARGKIDE
jgi:hypothetical protein